MINGLSVSGHSASASVRQSTGDRKALRPPSSARHRKETPKSSIRSSSNSTSDITQSAVFNNTQMADTDSESQLKLNLSILSSRSSSNDVKGSGAAETAHSTTCFSEKDSSSKNMLPLPDVLGNSDDFLSVVNNAAMTIQVWYRYRRRKRNKNLLMDVLKSKKAEKQEQSKNQKELTNIEKARLRQRKEEEEKRNQRRQAIEELRKKREEKAKEAYEKAEQEVKMIAEKKKGTNSINGNLRKSRVNKLPKQEAKVERDCGLVVKDLEQNPESLTPCSSGFPDGVTRTTNGSQENETEAESGLQSSRNTTIEDLFDTLKQLEQPDDFPENLKTTKFIVENSSSSVNLSSSSNSTSKHQTTEVPSTSTEGKKTAENKRLNEILEFLEQADREEEAILSGRVNNTDKTEMGSGDAENHDMDLPPPVLVPSAEDLVKMEEANKAAAEVTDSLLHHKLELAQKTRTVEMLTKALNQQRELTMRHAKEQDRETKRRMNELKQSLETKITRQTGFIDQLIESNTKLSEKCQSLTNEVKENALKYERKLRTVSEGHDAEKKKLKDTLMAAEKLRREKWMDEQTRNLKDITVKGLEPEIQKLIAGHKAEMRKLKALHEAEVAQADERAAMKYTHEKDLMRNNLQVELEAACEKERELARQRYEKQLEQEEQSYQQQRQRLYAEVQEEKSRVNELAHRQRQEVDVRQKQLEESNRKMMEDMRREYERARMEQEDRHSQELKEFKEKMEAERSTWEETYMKKQEAVLMQKEREMSEKVRSGRDKEIELVISRLETDMERSRVESEKAAENRVKRVREKYESEMREMEAVERNTMERYNTLKAQYAEVEGENARLKSVLKEKDHDLDQITKVKEKLTRERDSMSDVIRQEFADKLVSTDDENKRLKNEMSELKAKNRLEIDRITRDKEEEMAEVHKRVKQALVKKEEIVSQIRVKYEAAEKRADHLESLLESLRKQNAPKHK